MRLAHVGAHSSRMWGRVDDELSDLGRSLSPVLAALDAGACGHLVDVTASRASYDSTRTG